MATIEEARQQVLTQQQLLDKRRSEIEGAEQQVMEQLQEVTRTQQELRGQTSAESGLQAREVRRTEDISREALKKDLLAELGVEFEKQKGYEAELKTASVDIEAQQSAIESAQATQSATQAQIDADINVATRLVMEGRSFAGETPKIKKLATQIQQRGEYEASLRAYKEAGLKPITQGGKIVGFEDIVEGKSISVEDLSGVDKIRLDVLEKGGVITYKEVAPTVLPSKISPVIDAQKYPFSVKDIPSGIVTPEGIVTSPYGLGAGGTGILTPLVPEQQKKVYYQGENILTMNLREIKLRSQDISAPPIKTGIFDFGGEVKASEIKAFQNIRMDEPFSQIAAGTVALRLTSGGLFGEAAASLGREKGYFTIPEREVIVTEPRFGTQQYDVMGKPLTKEDKMLIPEQPIGTKKQYRAAGEFVGEVLPYAVPYFFTTEVGSKAGASVFKAGTIKGGAFTMLKDYPIESIVGAGVLAYSASKYLSPIVRRGTVRAGEFLGKEVKKIGEGELRFLPRGKRGAAQVSMEEGELIYDYVKRKWVRKKPITIDLGTAEGRRIITEQTRKAKDFEEALGKLRTAKTAEELEAASKKVKDLGELSAADSLEVKRLAAKKISDITGEEVLFTEEGFFIGKGKAVRVISKGKELGVAGEPTVKLGENIFGAAGIGKEGGILVEIKDTRFAGVGVGEKDVLGDLFKTGQETDQKSKTISFSGTTQAAKVAEALKTKAALKTEIALKSQEKLKTEQTSKQVLQSLLGFKTIQSQSQATSQITSQIIRQAPAPRTPKIPKKILFDLPETSSKREMISEAKEVMGAFKAFARKAGKDVELGVFPTIGGAKKRLKSELIETLRASGFVTKKGERVRIDLGIGFRPSKIEPLRVVQKKTKRFGSMPEVKEAQLFRRGGKKSKFF